MTAHAQPPCPETERTLQEGHVLLEVLRAMAGTTTPDAALNALIGVIKSVFSADCVAIAEQSSEGRVTLRYACTQDCVGTEITPPGSLLWKSKRLSDLRKVPGWEGALPAPLSQMRALLSVPFTPGGEGEGALICLSEAPEGFSAADQRQIKDLTTLARQAFDTLQLASQNALLGAAMSGAAAGVALVALEDGTPRIRYINSALQALRGGDAKALVGQGFETLVPRGAPNASRLNRWLVQGTDAMATTQVHDAAGQLHWVDVTLYPTLPPQKGETCCVVSFTDASARIEAEKDRDQVRRRLEAALSDAPDAFLLLDAKGKILFSNTSVHRLAPAPALQWAPGTHFLDNWHDALSRLSASRSVPDALRHPNLSHIVAQRGGVALDLPDGRQFRLQAMAIADGGMVLTASDLTRLKTAEGLLKQRAAAIDAAQDGIGIADETGHFTYTNPAMRALFNARVGALPAWPSLYQLPLSAHADLCAEFGQTGHIARQLIRRDGNETCYHDITFTNIEGVGIVLVVRDVTKRERNARQRLVLQSQLDAMRHKEALSDMAASIAHDFNNLLSAINGSALLISTDETATDALRDHADRITQAGHRAARMVNRLLDLNELSAPKEHGTFDLAQTLTDAMDLSRSSLPEAITLTISAKPLPSAAIGDATEALRAIFNLLLNARDACANGGAISATLDVAPELSNAPSKGTLDPSISYARLCIYDTGTGMSDEVLEHIFEPYFSTKGSTGTGLGLSSILNIIREFDGALNVQSKPGEGSTFTLFWPLESPISALQTSFENLRNAPILIIDDEANVAEVLAGWLTRCGAEVSTLSDPQLALETLLEDPDDWAAVICDYDMPGMSGGDLVAAVRAANLTVPIVLVTALARRMADPRVAPPAVQAVLAKPVDMHTLSKTVSAALEPPKGH